MTERSESILHRIRAHVSYRVKAVWRLARHEAFSREKRSVKHGIATYRRMAGSGTDLFLLRRNVHMLEKGLSMRPRRSQFALEYIAQTVDSFESCVRREGGINGSTESQWMLAVLSEYFDATAASTHQRIVDLRDRFSEITDKLALLPDSRYGPQPPAIEHPQVSIGDLTQLARSRQSIRWFLDEHVPRDAIDRAVIVAAESPTACNRQPYRFEIFDDSESIEKVASIPMGTRGFVHQIPAIAVVVGDLSAFFDERDRHLIYVDGCLAAMGFIYGLQVQGISSCCINWPDIPERETRMATLLKLKPYERVIMLIAFGYADPAGLAPHSAKREIENIRTFEVLR